METNLIEITPETAKELYPEAMVEEMGYTYVHITGYPNLFYDSDWWINIWRTTFLVDSLTNDSIELISAVNIPFGPDRHYFKHKGDRLNFTLIFPKLPKSWEAFHLFENAPSGGFEIRNIGRNETGIYRLKL